MHYDVVGEKFLATVNQPATGDTVFNTNLLASRGASILAGLGSHSLPPSLYRVAVNGTYMVARSFFLLFLNSSAWPCLAPPQLCYGYHFVHLWGTASERARSVCTFLR